MTAPLPEDPALIWNGSLTGHEAFLEHPIVHAYVAMRVWGKPEIHRDVVVAEIRARSQPGRRVLMLAPGHGERELAVVEALPDRTFDIVSLAGDQAMVEAATRRGLDHVKIHAAAEDGIPELGDDFDVFVSLYAMHRRADLEDQWSRVRQSLRSGGSILAQEYVGPARFAWPEAQREAANLALRSLAPEHRPHHDEVGSALAATLRAAEPGIAERSDELLSTCQASGFRIVAEVGCGCALLHPVLTGQVHTFETANWSHNRGLAQLFETEDLLMQREELGHDFAMFIAQPS